LEDWSSVRVVGEMFFGPFFHLGFFRFWKSDLLILAQF
jgi:hypothetical protein